MTKSQFTIATLILSIIGGCADMPIAGLRWPPAESQKQAAQVAADLSTDLSSTGARPSSAALRTLAKSTRAAATYAGQPERPVDVSALAALERDQWRQKDDQVAAATLRDDLRSRAMSIVTGRLAGLTPILADNDADAGKVMDRVAAIASIATMADDLAGSIPDPRPPGVSAETAAIAQAARQAAETIAQAADRAAAVRPSAGDVVDTTMDNVDKTAKKIVQTGERAVAIYEKYAPEIISILGGLGVLGVGYGVKKRKDATRATQERDNAVAAPAVVSPEMAAAVRAAIDADRDPVGT